MKSLATLIKLQKTKVDEQRILVARMQEQLDIVTRKIDALQHEQEQQRALLRENPEVALTYGEYVKNALVKMKALERVKNAAEYALNLAREKLTEVYEEQKRYELAEQNRLDEEEREQQHRETLTLDEVGSISFVRKHKKRQGH